MKKENNNMTLTLQSVGCNHHDKTFACMIDDKQDNICQRCMLFFHQNIDPDNLKLKSNNHLFSSSNSPTFQHQKILNSLGVGGIIRIFATTILTAQMSTNNRWT